MNHPHSVSSTVDDEITLLHDEGPPTPEVCGRRLDRGVARVGVSRVLGLSPEQVRTIQSDPCVVPFAAEKMALDEQVRVIRIKAGIWIRE